MNGCVWKKKSVVMGQWIGRVNSPCVLNDTSLNNFCISFDSKKQMLISGKVIKLYSWRIIWKERRCICLACQKVFLQLFSESDLRKYCTTNWNKMCCFSSARTEFSQTFLFRLQTRKPLLCAMPSGAIFLPASQGCAWDSSWAARLWGAGTGREMNLKVSLGTYF